MKQAVQGWYYDYGTNLFREAATKEEQCKINLLNEWPKSKTNPEIEEMRTEYHKYCPTSKSNNIISCPKDIIKKKNDLKLKWLNDYFKEVGKKGKKKKKTKRKRKKSRKGRTKNTKKKRKQKKKKSTKGKRNKDF